MRKLAWVIAVLALAGCGEGRDVDPPKPKVAATTAPTAAAAPQWGVEVRGEIPQAVSDLTAWLIEHSFVSSVVKDNGKARVLVGPFNSKAEAEAKQEQLNAALVRAKKRNIESLVVDYPTAQ
ncbi:SPOR domain-containing protein [Pseudomonas fluorescens]|uniref:SPOR domain-containing protein n=1 Tax=Pseudomonas fluorescens TaxID=294 RepID=A0A944HDC6_PSEFL|nr:SPOR domain-containing protein [Pseudomonas fluorescens]MBT2306706.1 SPOR domain-containing protein [Pseudomonas fluorescens]MBT2316384.1 SPOR domain-containing protein [Pseudomonas fluorescens]MBT2330176.1 SPOR domain-containing protein [Pseudomonas fluorescens]MBT2342889.1 SPOR domain-containing protein [Pseudomonas fluorescens]